MVVCAWSLALTWRKGPEQGSEGTMLPFVARSEGLSKEATSGVVLRCRTRTST